MAKRIRTLGGIWTLNRRWNVKRIRILGKPVVHARFDFYFSGRRWYRYSKGDAFIGPVRSRTGILREAEDIQILARGFDAAFAAIGAKIESYTQYEDRLLKECRSCKNTFVAKRSTARFCKTCRENVYARRKKQPGYVKENRDQARSGMARLRTEKYTSQNKRDRRTAATLKKEAEAGARKAREALVAVFG